MKRFRQAELKIDSNLVVKLIAAFALLIWTLAPIYWLLVSAISPTS